MKNLALAYNIMKKNRVKKLEKMADGGMVSDENMARKNFDYAMDAEGKEHNEDLDPMDEPEQGAESLTMRVSRMAKGGMARSPSGIAQAVKMRRMSKGGMTDCYADGGEVDDDVDTMPDYSMGDDDFTAEGPEDEIPNMTYPDPDGKEDTEGQGDRAMEGDDSKMKRRGMLKGIMRELSAAHYGKK